MASYMNRTTDNIVIIVHNEGDSPLLPFELQNSVASETWDFRLRQVRRLCAQYSKPMLERVWFCISFLATIIVPAVLYNVIFNIITPKSVRDEFDNSFNRNSTFGDERKADDDISKFFWEAKGITFGIFVGIALVFWGPLIAWKQVGTFRANAMTRRWAQEDSSRGTSSFIPRWTVKTPGVFNVNGRILITTPPQNASNSLFGPGANIPPYMLQPAANGPPPPGAFYSYSYGPNGNPSGAMMGYAAPQGPPPPGLGPQGAAPMLVSDDEKYRRDEFDDVKV